MANFKIIALRALHDIRYGRHLEAYAVFAIGLVLVVLGLIGVASSQLLLSAILLAATLLVYTLAQRFTRSEAA